MTRLRRPLTARPARLARRRGATLLEFLLILPLLIFVSLFTVDMGHVILVNGAMQDAAYAAARAGAQVGGGSLDPATGTFPCGTGASGSTCRTGVSYEAFSAAVGNIPGFASGKVIDPQMRILSGGRCEATANAVRPDNHVTVEVSYSQELITPGLALLMQWSGSRVDDSRWVMSVTATSRCEVVR
jgi:hypothetical protein